MRKGDIPISEVRKGESSKRGKANDLFGVDGAPPEDDWSNCRVGGGSR